jgi:multifunctional 2-oxoglutarate metabolism enzyme
VAIQPDQDVSAAAQDFGANDWLIEEMYERYEADPSSVDPTWADFFRSHAGALPLTPPADTASPSTPVRASAAAEQTPAAPLAGEQTPAAAEQAPPAPAPAEKTQTPTAVPEQAPPAPAAASVNTSQPAPAAPVPQAAPPTSAQAAAPTPDLTATMSYLPAQPPSFAKRPAPVTDQPTREPLRGAPLRTAKNMDLSLEMPTATSVRTVPMKLVIDHRTMINAHLARTIGGKVSFTHIIGWAMVQAMKAVPAMNVAYEVVDGKPMLVEPDTINLGIAIDMTKPDGTRQLLVPNIRSCEQLTFGQFWSAYEQVVSKARKGQLTVDDFAGTTATLTNPGGIGTNHSIPRLMAGQGLILGVGSIEYAPGYLGASPERLNELGISKVMTLTSTYDHRVIQGAQSGEFLRAMENLLLGRNGFYEEIFTSLRIPYAPLEWDTDIFVGSAPELVDKEARVLELISSYRALGHLVADIDPLTYRMRNHADLALKTHGLTLWDLDRTFPCGSLGGKPRTAMTLRDALETLRDAYCRHIGVEYMHITDRAQRAWLQEQLEQPPVALSRDEHLRIMDKLNESEIFETFLQTKFIGQKRFSLEGGESTIVILDEICEQAADLGLGEVIIGMPHRGRLNVLANIVGKSYGQIFREFEGSMDPHNTQGTGDVKYHLGAEGEFVSATGSRIRTSVAANPSHLEAVDPVVEGIARAKQDRAASEHEYPVLPLLLHGDAAFAGQGVVYETLQMSQLRGYRTGGTIHVVVNNQVGFTTAPVESRSSTYCTDLAKVVEAPVFHVNGDDPDACVRVARLAFEFRQRFAKDVVIDLVCYRKRGHNEGDDPSFTQPLMYDLIEAKRSTRKIYTDALIGRGDITTDDADEYAEKFRIRLETVFKEIRSMTAEANAEEEYRKVPYYPAKLGKGVGTSISAEVMERIATAMTEFPEGFTVHPKVLPQLERRADMIRKGPMDWATAEALAVGSLLMEGRPVRMSGQDTRRGTFSQRFAAVVDRRTNESWVPLKHLAPEQGTFDIYDSLLSEYAVMGFEYGYSVAAPEALVCWEGQFGDFANGAQTIIDEFIASGQAKWTQKSGVVLLLPHGYEGQGPDHSSARIERWLQLCSEGALAVCQPSTPASYFHLLRTHAYVNWHRPVVIITPKSMLRNKLAMSMPSEITGGRWQPAMDDPTITDPSAVTRLVLCSGKIRWSLVAAREKLGLQGQVAIIPLERLYPLPVKELAAVLDRYGHVSDIRYAQDEPSNQGAWWYMERNLPAAIKTVLPGYDLVMTPVTREEASAPSVGSHHLHEEQEAALLKAALGGGEA